MKVTRRFFVHAIRPSSFPLVTGFNVRYMKIAGVFSLAFLLLGCVGMQPRLAEYYILEYPALAVEGIARLPEAIKVRRFSAAQALNSRAMIYRPGPYKLAVYNYHYWRVNPADMITDLLLRDLRNCGLFQTVYSDEDPEDARFILQGNTEEFWEVDDNGSGKAVLGLSVALIDSSQRGVTQRVVFQKKYRLVESMGEQTPAGLARSISRAVERMSERLIHDLHDAATGLRGVVNPQGAS